MVTTPHGRLLQRLADGVSGTLRFGLGPRLFHSGRAACCFVLPVVLPELVMEHLALFAGREASTKPRPTAHHVGMANRIHQAQKAKHRRMAGLGDKLLKSAALGSRELHGLKRPSSPAVNTRASGG